MKRGMTLIECLVAIVLSSVLLAAVELGLLAGRRFARDASASRSVGQNLRAGAGALRAEIEGLDAAAGDFVNLTDSALTIRGSRGTGVVCAVVSAGNILLDDSLLSLARPINPATDSALVFAEGTRMSGTDDRWILAGIAQVRSGTCPRGGSATGLVLTGAAADLADIDAGAPVRVFEIAQYRRYQDATGAWWLGIRNPSGTGWSATSPIAGPLIGRTGLRFEYLDPGLNPTTAVDSVAVVTLHLGMSDTRLPSSDSTIMRAATRMQ